MLKSILKNNNNVVVNGYTPLLAIKADGDLKVKSGYTIDNILNAEVIEVYQIKGVIENITRVKISL